MDVLLRRHMDGDDMSSMTDDDSTGSCKVSMLWNWYTIDACFLSTSWHIKNNGMFAASCIGVALLVVCLEGLRRLGSEFDLAMHRQWRAHAASVAAAQASSPAAHQTPNLLRTDAAAKTGADNACEEGCHGVSGGSAWTGSSTITYRPTILQQLLRAVIHAITFGLAYILMLLAMYYNGYIIISIILGAALGKFLCDWRPMTIPISLGASLASATAGPVAEGKAGNYDTSSLKSTEGREPTVCCG